MGGGAEAASAQDVPRAAAKNDGARSRPRSRDLANRMRQPEVASELFFPLQHAAFDDRGRLRINKGEVRAVRTQISGVRFCAADPERENLAPERAVQRDVVRLVRSVIALRGVEGLEGAVLGPRGLKCRQPVKGEGTRVKFGLVNDAKGRCVDDMKAARRCHKSIVRAIRRSGFVVQHPTSFDASTGLTGLVTWGSELLLRRRRRWWPWLLLLLPLLLLRQCDEAESFFGVPIETESFIILVDKSGSMQKWFPVVQAEARSVLDRMEKAGGTRYADVIAYAGSATSALGKISEVDESTIRELNGFLDKLAAGGGTNLRSGIEQAAREVAAHDRPTTLIILTDAQDGSIPQMLQDMKATLSGFKGVEIVGNALTPRLFGGSGDPTPQDDHERALKELAQGMHGRFGPQEDRP